MKKKKNKTEMTYDRKSHYLVLQTALGHDEET